MKIYDLSIFHLTRYKGTIKLSYLQIYYVNKIKKKTVTDVYNTYYRYKKHEE